MKQLSDPEIINYILGVLHLNPKQFAESLDLSRADAIYNIMKGRNAISTNMAKRIISKYPMINHKWLISGFGEPLLSYNSPSDRIKGLMVNHKLEPIGLAMRIGLKYAGEIMDVIEKDKEPSKELLAAIVEKFPDDREFLLKGLDLPIPAKETIENSMPGVINVPLITKYSKSMYLQRYDDEEFLETLPKVPFLVEGTPKGIYRCFETPDDSMYDGSANSYPINSIVLCREVPKMNWGKLSSMINDWDFILVHKEEGVIIRRIVKFIPDKGILTVHLLNQMYEDYNIHLLDVVQFLNVVKMERSMKR